MNTQDVFIMAEEGVDVPTYGSDEAAGADIRAQISEEITLHPGDRHLIPTGLYFEIPQGFEIQVRPRSGLALKHGITLLNTPGTIDSDYRGEVGVILINHGNKPFTVVPGMRIAQIVLMPVVQARYIKKESLRQTERGRGGFGHTGVH